jgi:CBS domain-containing protein
MINGRTRKISVQRVLDDDLSTQKTSAVSTPAASRRQSVVTFDRRPRQSVVSATAAFKRSIANSVVGEGEVDARSTEGFGRYKSSLMLDIHDPDQEFEWEDYELSQTIDFTRCRVNNAPFQIVSKMSLYQLHSLFSLLRLHHALVMSRGRLVGIISLTEVRAAIQGEVDTGFPLQSTIRQRITDSCSCMPSQRRRDEFDDNGNMENFEFGVHSRKGS